MENYKVLKDNDTEYLYLKVLSDSDYCEKNYSIFITTKKIKKSKKINRFIIKNTNNVLNMLKLLLFTNEEEIQKDEILINIQPEIISIIMMYIKKYHNSKYLIKTESENIYKDFYNYLEHIIFTKYKNNNNFKIFKTYMIDIKKITKYETKTFLLLEIYKSLIVKKHIDKQENPYYNKIFKPVMKYNDNNKKHITKIKRIYSGKQISITFGSNSY